MESTAEIGYRDHSGRAPENFGKCSGWYVDHPALIHEGAAANGVGPFLTREAAEQWFAADPAVLELRNAVSA